MFLAVQGQLKVPLIHQNHLASKALHTLEVSLVVHVLYHFLDQLAQSVDMLHKLHVVLGQKRFQYVRPLQLNVFLEQTRVLSNLLDRKDAVDPPELGLCLDEEPLNQFALELGVYLLFGQRTFVDVSNIGHEVRVDASRLLQGGLLAGLEVLENALDLRREIVHDLEETQAIVHVPLRLDDHLDFPEGDSGNLVADLVQLDPQLLDFAVLVALLRQTQTIKVHDRRSLR